MGLYYEDLEIGREFVSPGRTITETDVVQFAGLSGDYNPIHTDAEFARDSAFGERIAHGLLGVAVISGLSARLGIFDGTAVAFLGLTWDFTGPIRLGDTVHLRMTIAAKRETSNPERGIVEREMRLINQHGETVQKGIFKLMIRRRTDEKAG
ncbi:MAG: dehydratase [Salinisphaeraceae bacterium]|nr:dehydratase [Salinisphaeraceae bacterium]